MTSFMTLPPVTPFFASVTKEWGEEVPKASILRITATLQPKNKAEDNCATTFLSNGEYFCMLDSDLDKNENILELLFFSN